ncbi:MAG: phage virion morphogenesis protein [Deltaproteobacteria bacterium GWC2_56_8]|nr:MAG: phage virion morphogenesis protein [Deltaproteobacteria bacterium GWB2_55_19]OGP34639.1 MAG: phage virion morphogenesis protein [Deltaproteobacteria bacterium GWC2_56_8]
MADGIDVRIDDSEVQRLLDKVSERASDMTPAMRVIGEIAKVSIIKNFEVGGRYSEPGSWRGGSNRWQPLALATVLGGFRKKAVLTKRGRYKKPFMDRLRDGNRKVLIKERHLMGSITSNPTSNSVEVGTNKEYAAIHNFGGEAGRKSKRVTIPARPFLVLQDEDLKEIKETLENHLTGGS